MSVELSYTAARLEDGKSSEMSSSQVEITATEINTDLDTDEADIDDDVDTHFPDIAVDPNQDYKATEIKIFSCAAPHMRQFHFTWDLNLSANDIFDSNIISVAATVLARFTVGPLCDAYGARRHWTANMFAKNIIGTATATVGGWGNLGGGVTQIFMVVMWNLLRKDTDDEIAWRTVFVIPAGLVVCLAIALWLCTQDTPLGDQIPAYLEKSRRLSVTRSAEVQMSVWSNSGAWILFIHYAMCFGVELTVNNVAATYFNEKFDLSTTSAGMIASLFGLMNLFARSLGGILSDYMGERRGMQGRLWVQAGTLVMEGIFIIIFSLMESMASSIGSTYSLVPSVQPKKKGAVSGIVGAGGNLGAVCWGFFFRFGSKDFDKNFLYIGIIVIISSLLTTKLKLEGYGDWEFFERTDIEDETASDSEKGK
eukprot:GSChrysophyteH1.ASY1.ANO1.2268.1 assembled CDS